MIINFLPNNRTIWPSLLQDFEPASCGSGRSQITEAPGSGPRVALLKVGLIRKIADPDPTTINMGVKESAALPWTNTASIIK